MFIRFEQKHKSELVQDDCKNVLTELLAKYEELILIDGSLKVILMCGINGTGKTTTVGKLLR